MDLAVKLDIIQKSGAWFSYNDERLGNGKEKVKALLSENKELFNEILEKVKAAIKGGNAPVSLEDEDSSASEE